MARRVYNLRAVVLTINGIRIEGFGDDDAIEFTWNSDVFTKRVTADGKVIYSTNNDGSAEAAITVAQAENGYAALHGLQQAQAGEVLGIPITLITPYGFSLIDPSNGDSIIAGQTVFMNRGAPSKGKASGDAQFRLDLANPAISLGSLNVVPDL